MKGRMQEISTQRDNFSQKSGTVSEGYVGVQTFIGITEDNLMEVRLTIDSLMEQILSPTNLNIAYKEVVSNKGSGGIDQMQVAELLPWLHEKKGTLINNLLTGTYHPNPVRRVDIPKGEGKTCAAGITCVVDRFIQQSLAQVIYPLYELEFRYTSYGFRSRRSCHDALRCVQKRVTSGYKYAVDLDLEKFFDTVSYSRLIELLSRKIKDGRVFSLIHKYLTAGIQLGGLFAEMSSSRGSTKSVVKQHNAP
jgi:group II intron reverse transcriptase/maturase